MGTKGINMRNFKTLTVWQKSHALTLKIYDATTAFPKEEIYALTSQLRRAASSVAANIAEGCGRQGDADFARFLQIAMGSASELQYHLILARDLGFLSSSVFGGLEKETVEVKQMLSSLIKKLRAEC